MQASSAEREPIRRPELPDPVHRELRDAKATKSEPAWVKRLTPREREERAAVIASKGTRSLNRLVQVTQPPAPVTVRWLPEPVQIPDSSLRILGVCEDASEETKRAYSAQ